MKHLTSKILMALVVAGFASTANAAITSKDYVDDQNDAQDVVIATKAVKQGAGAVQVATVDANGQYIRSGTALGDLATASQITTIEGDISTINTTLQNVATTEGLGDLTDRVTAVEGVNTTQNTNIGNKQDKLSGTSGSVVTYGATAGTVGSVTLGALATKNTVAAADIDADAVTTTKIVDANVTRAKLATDVTSSLGLADSAVQPEDLDTYSTTSEIATAITDGAVQTVVGASGTNQGTVKLTVDGVTTDNIAVTGLGSAAYTATSAYATAIQGATADTTAQTLETNDTVAKANSALQSTALTTINDSIDTKQDKLSGTAGSVITYGATAGTVGSVTLGSLATAAPGACSDATNQCVLVFNGTDYSWEVVQR